jgi:hypothetical protein
MKIINLETEQLKKICQQWQIVELALFGSILRENFNSNSDIDVLGSFSEKEVDLKILWEVIQTSIPQLLAQVKAAFDSQ